MSGHEVVTILLKYTTNQANEPGCFHRWVITNHAIPHTYLPMHMCAGLTIQGTVDTSYDIISIRNYAPRPSLILREYSIPTFPPARLSPPLGGQDAAKSHWPKLVPSYTQQHAQGRQVLRGIAVGDTLTIISVHHLGRDLSFVFLMSSK